MIKQAIDNLLNYSVNKTIQEEPKPPTGSSLVSNKNDWSININEINLLVDENTCAKEEVLIEMKNHLNKELVYDIVHRRV